MLDQTHDVLDQIGDMMSPVTAHASPCDVGGPGQEIEAVIHLNADAADRIMEAAEQISYCMEVEGVPDEVRFTVLNRVTAIFEACGFQDLTGQRIQHALKTLRTIEESLLGRTVAVAAPHDKIDQAYADSVIDGKGGSQADIDSLFG
jgi:chemotaxis protein CheZ